MSTLDTWLCAAVDAAMPRFCILCEHPVARRITRSSVVAAYGQGSAGDAAARTTFRDGCRGMPLCTRCAGNLRPIEGVRCRRCGKPEAAGTGFCERCSEPGVSIDAVVPVFEYGGSVAELIRMYKSGERNSLASWLASLVVREAVARWPDRIFVPVPPRPEKTRGRGWDHVEAIRNHIGRSGLSTARCLVRSGSVQQKRLGREDRAKNAAKSYRVLRGVAVPEAVVLVDDVYTTGATLEACAAALKTAGTRVVSAIVLAVD